MHSQEEFTRSAEINSFNPVHRLRSQAVMHRYQYLSGHAREQYMNLPLAKDRAAYYKWKILENLDKYLIEFEANILRKGGKVLWALDAEAARNELESIMKRLQVRHVLKSKTSAGEEIGLNSFLKSKDIQVHETYTGDYIQQAAGQPSFHMTFPAMDKNSGEISQLLNDKISVSLEASPEEIIADIRQELRPAFNNNTIAITGANFLIAENGMVAISENEGNIGLSIAFAKTHIVLAGIDKVIPSMNDLDTFFPLLATYSSGQHLTTYNTLVAPRQASDTDGPAEFIVILIDNGRSNVLAQADQRQALSCIKCGACSNVCPVFQTIGGYAYHTAYNGPIGSVMTPHMQGLDEYKHLGFASTICGKCTDICPVKIDLHNHLLRNRRDSVNQGHIKSGEKLIWYSWKKMMLNRKNMNKGASVKNFMLRSFFKSAWGERREFPKIADKSFNQLWRDRSGQ